MPNKSSKNGSERFWPTPSTFDQVERTMERHKEREQFHKAKGVHLQKPLVIAVQESMMTSSPSTEPNTPGLTCSQGDFLANLSASPGGEEAQQMTVRSGLKCCELLMSQNPVGSLVRTLLASSRWNSIISFLTWKASATPRGRLLFRLVPSMPDTEGTEFGLWRTPNAAQADRGAQNGAERLAQGHTMSLQDQVKMWPTPQANDDRDRGSSASGAVLRRIEKGKQVMLSQSVSTVNGSLNPNWVEWLMGYPKDWTAVEHFASGRKKTPARQESALESSTGRTA